MTSLRNPWGVAAVLAAIAIVLAVALQKRPATMHEFDGYRSRYFELMRMDIPDRTGTVRNSFVVPVGWQSGLTPSDNFWLSDRDANYIVQRTVRAKDLAGGAETARQAIIDEISSGPPSKTAVMDQRTYASGRYTIFESATDMLYDGERVMTQHLFRIWPDGSKMYGVGYHVIVRNGLWDRPETRDIIDLFRAQLLRAEMWAAPSVQDRLPAAKSDGRFNFRDLRAVDPHGFMAISLPRLWSEHVRDGTVGYYDPKQRTGALWVGYHVIVRDHNARMKPSRDVDRYWRKSDDPDIERLQWMVKDTTADRSMVVLIDLVLDKGQADQPEFKELIVILDEEIRRMKIGMPPSDAKATREIGSPSTGRGRT